MTRVFGVDYTFRACGAVFTDGLVHAAAALGLPYAHRDWTDQSLPAQVAAFKPDLLFVVHGRKFVQHRLRRMKPGAYRSAVWLLDEPYEVDDTSHWSDHFDAVFVNDPSSVPRHAGAAYLPVCYDPVVHYPGTGDRPHAVGFIGGGNAVRDEYLGALADRKLLTYVIGGPWSHAGLQQLERSRNIPAAQTSAWYRSTKIVVNIWREQHHFNREHVPATSLNPRIYEALACGALVVSAWRPELDTVFPEVPVFRTVEECVDLVQSLLHDPERAETIRQACAARLTGHTYTDRLTQVLAHMGMREAAA